MSNKLSVVAPSGYKFLYHGSYMPFNDPDLSKSYGISDFGRGFYLTESINMARKWAKSKAKRKFKQYGYVMQFIVNINCWPPANTMTFSYPTISWLNYVTLNRGKLPKWFDITKDKDILENPDVVIGPTADSDVVYALNQYSAYLRDNRYGLNGQDAIDALEVHNLKNQICVKTSKGLAYLKYVNKEVVKV